MKNKSKQDTTKVLEKFLKKQYMNCGGAVTMDIAIRDCLTDLFHIAEGTGTNLSERLVDAEEVYTEEIIDRTF